MIVWKLDSLMRLRGVKGRELARRMGIGENYLSRVRHEVPDRLSLTLLDTLCRELECHIGDLLEYQPASLPPEPVVESGAVYLKTGALQAKLNRLKQRRNRSSEF